MYYLPCYLPLLRSFARLVIFKLELLILRFPFVVISYHQMNDRLPDTNPFLSTWVKTLIFRRLK
jgi:hypothetical protein